MSDDGRPMIEDSSLDLTAVTTTQSNEELFASGCPVGCTGLYAVFHAAHQLPREVILIKGEPFPHCGCCSLPVIFELRKATHLFSWAAYSAVRLHVLPVCESDGASDPSSAAREHRVRQLRRVEAELRTRSWRNKTVKNSRLLRAASLTLRTRARHMVALSRSNRERSIRLMNPQACTAADGDSL